MKLGPKGHLTGLLAILWTGGAFSLLIVHEVLPLAPAVAIWVTGIALLLFALFLFDQREIRGKPSPICRILISAIYGCFGVSLFLKMIRYIEEGYYTYFAALVFIGLTFYAAFLQARKALSEIRNEN